MPMDRLRLLLDDFSRVLERFQLFQRSFANCMMAFEATAA